MGLVRASDLGSTRRLGEPVVVPISLVGVERLWRISIARISRNSDKSMGPGGSTAG